MATMTATLTAMTMTIGKKLLLLLVEEPPVVEMWMVVLVMMTTTTTTTTMTTESRLLLVEAANDSRFNEMRKRRREPGKIKRRGQISEREARWEWGKGNDERLVSVVVAS